MDLLSLVGIIVGLIAIIGGQFLEGGQFRTLINGPAMLIVLGGTLGAVMLETPFTHFKRALRIMIWVVFPPRYNLKQDIEKLVVWSSIARKEGLLGLEAAVESEHDQFSKKALFLLIDGGEPNMIRNILEVEMQVDIRKDQHAARVFESMGGYSPTIGIIGAVLGLIQVMTNLSDPSKLGAGIAVAFVATIYGVGLANMFFLPVGAKLQSYIQKCKQRQQLIIEGILCISEGENPRVIEMKLLGMVGQ